MPLSLLPTDPKKRERTLIWIGFILAMAVSLGAMVADIRGIAGSAP